VRPRPKDLTTKGASSKLAVFLIHIDGNKTFRGFFPDLLQRHIAAKAEGQPLHGIRDERQSLQYLSELITGVAGFHDYKMYHVRSAGKIAFPCKNDSPLLSGLA